MYARTWARRVMGGADLGDARRTARLVRMAERVAQSPGGRVTDVFRDLAERQASYDLLESDHVTHEKVTETVARSTAHACASRDRVLIVLDGTSITVTDRQRTKGLGSVGTSVFGATGGKLINALALTTDGTPIGVADQIWWMRTKPAASGYRRPEARESAHWRSAVDRIGERFARCAPGTKVHFVADREADASLLIQQLVAGGHEFTIRSNANRKVLGARGPAGIRSSLRQRRPVASMTVTLRANGRRAARVAHLDIRAARVELLMRDRHLHERKRAVPVTYVWARERGRARGLDWMLVTNTEVPDARAACAAVATYTARWRIEDFHKTWKSGLCHVEDTQLRSVGAIIKWATVLAAVASRAQQLRHQLRDSADAPADTILSKDEIQALVLLKERYKKRTETIDPTGLTVAKAVMWIANVGGHAAYKNTGPPGPITIARGLRDVEATARVIAELRKTGRMR
jgi:hypothetical protein